MLLIIYVSINSHFHLEAASRVQVNMPRNRAAASTPARSPSGSHRVSSKEVRSERQLTVVGIGASAGGLDACTKLVNALPDGNGMAFILVQHLDPTHESMMVDLLASHTGMTVEQVTDGMLVEAGHFYVIPPGTYLSIAKGALRLSQPRARRGARLPYDYLLSSMAEECGTRGVGVILSGTGADGSLGLKALKEHGGLVIAQDPDEAEHDGMPRNAIMTGAVDLVLPVADIPAALIKYDRNRPPAAKAGDWAEPEGGQDRLADIIDVLRTQTVHDFRLYKQGTLRRRIERRMAMAGVEPGAWARYLAILRDDRHELDLLVKDLLINVTSFFRDPKVFDHLAEKIVPGMVRGHAPDQPLRIWIAGCSTGEETYSLAMIFREQITAAKRNIRLQVFASDVDADAVTAAREGLYPETIEAEVSQERLSRFFTKEGHSYRVSPELRASVVFTVQDVLSDPPFSRLDMVSCRNLLIYLRPEAQAKVMSIFHFALQEGGVLLLGSAETVGVADTRFQVISKPARLYRHIGRSRPGETNFSLSADGGIRVPVRPSQVQGPSRQTVLGDLCRRLVLENHAPAAVLINSKHECLYSLGPTDHYLHVAPGRPTHDLFAMVREGMHNALRSAIHLAGQQNARVVVPGGGMKRGDRTVPFSIDALPVEHDGESLLLICFVDEPVPEQRQGAAAISPADMKQVDALQQELDLTRTELHDAIRNLEKSSEEQKAINEEALSVNEEFQSTNEELLTSKEELQSLNEELTALNSQLQETLERQRTTSNDLQNVLYSTDVATLFLDTDLNIRFFTPATRSLFSVIPGDVGRPIGDLSSLAMDSQLQADARQVLKTFDPVEREIETGSGTWFIRRILPYRADDAVEGVVVTYTNVTERKQIAKALEAATRESELANVAKSRFLAAASHDLRQPLQTLVLLQGLLAKAVTGERALTLVKRLDEGLGAMSGILNTLLDINQIEADTVRAERVVFPVMDLLERLTNEFAYHAQAQGLVLHAVPCTLSIYTDPRLLEQMIRNLLSNALKYTPAGKVLLGCRRRNGHLSIEVWDTGVGIPEREFEAIFEEYHQLDNAARERSRGLGLGLSIVKHLGRLLGHHIRVHSRGPGKGSMFAVEVALPPAEPVPLLRYRPGLEVAPDTPRGRTGSILVVEDDPDVRDLLELFLHEEGHHVLAARDGEAALDLVAHGTLGPDLVLADYNLPNGMNGLQVAAALREKLRRDIPVIILTGDISTGTLRAIADGDCVHLDKPVKVAELTQAIQLALPAPRTAPQVSATRPAMVADPSAGVVFVVDDDVCRAVTKPATGAPALC
jgi:two-component system CheB/CheR fusion protein